MFWKNNYTLIIFFSVLKLFAFVEYQINYYYDYWSSSLVVADTESVFDFIIVGGGTTGAVIANRLSRNNKVLLIEAGGDPLFVHSIPGFAPSLLGDTASNWMYRSIPQVQSQLSKPNQISTWYNGKLLGGSSNLNYVVHTTGSRSDYDNWANITGDAEWTYESLTPLIKKTFNQNGVYSGRDDVQATQKMFVEKRHWNPVVDSFVAAAEELKFPLKDLNNAEGEGVAPFDVTEHKGQRWGSYNGYIRGILKRPSLTIARYSIATKVILDKSNRAIGVVYTRHGKSQVSFAKKEVILSAGAIGSPKLLMLSGIGPKEHLSSTGIRTKINLPVGENLMDHFGTTLMPIVINSSVSYIPDRDFSLETIYDYVANGRGPLTSPGVLMAHILMCSSSARKDSPDKKGCWPDIQINFNPIGMYSNIVNDMSTYNGVRPETLSSYLTKFIGKDAFILQTALMRPKSKGTIKLVDSNPFSPPLIDPNYFGDIQDMQALQEGLQMSFNIVTQTKSFKNLNAQLPLDKFPGCENFDAQEPAYWECYVRQWGISLTHPAGTCRMGKAKGDPLAVVDSKLRVLGTYSLRVADASIMPEIVNMNTNSPCVLIGEKAAETIQNYWATQYLVCQRISLILYDDFEKCFYSEFP